MDGSGRTGLGVGKTGNYGWSDHLRIHSTIDFGEPYPVRQRVKDVNENDRDILWVRVESEPMLIGPDATEEYSSTNLNGGKGIFGLNSVRQIIITNSASNTGENDRPIVIFYDGPERYSTDNPIRDSLPVIVYLKADFNGIIYVPNSPVVFMPNGHDFHGFIVAKSYMRLKTKEDFENEIEKYERVDDNNKVSEDGENFREKAETNNDYYRKIHTLKDEDGNIIKTKERDNGEPEKIHKLYAKIVNPENDIEMYVDDYGNVQFMDYPDSPTKYGMYDTFGRTDFTTHNYHIAQESANNLLLSGK